uniref:Putative tick transposon n=1 Tax=Ixodes ricinus TaxID=34613 RepID=A0A147BKW6_IXORI
MQHLSTMPTILVWFFSAETVDVLFDMANQALSALAIWSRINSLQINVDKTKAVIFCPKHKLVTITRDIVLNSSKIEVVKSFKLLGVIFTETMLWNSRVYYLISKLSQVVGVVNRHRYMLPAKVKLLIYYSLFYSQINYCNLV